MCVLSLIYGYVAVSRFCTVHCVIIICFCWLLSNYSTLYSFYVCLLFCVFYVSVLLCVLFLLLHIAVSFLRLYKSTDHSHRVETHLQ